MGATDTYFIQLRAMLAALRRRALLLTSAETLVRATAAGLALGGLWLLLEAALYLDPWLRNVAGLICLLLTLGLTGRDLATALPPLLSEYRFALLLERTYPRLSQQLISALALWQNPRAEALYSHDLLAATVDDAARSLQALDAGVLLDRGRLRRRVRQAGLVGALLAAALLLSGDLRSAAWRCSQPRTRFQRLPDTLIAVEPGDQSVIKGDDAPLIIRFSGVRPKTARILRRDDPETPWQEEEIVVERADSVRYSFAEVHRSFHFQVRAGDGISTTHRIHVIDPPRVQRLRMDLQYPEYSGLPPRREEESGDIHALAGTRVVFQIHASKPLAAATLVWGDSLRLPATVSGSQAEARLEVTRNGRYHIELVDLQGVTNRAPIRHAVKVLTDAPPRVSLAAPARDMDLPESMQVLLAVDAVDDFGLASLQLIHRTNDGPQEVVPLPFEPGRDVHLAHLWDLSAADLLPEDRIVYRVVAQDNDTVSGPKRSSSREYVLRFPSLYELYEEATAAQEEQLQGLQELAEQGRQAGEYLEEVRRELLKREELTWEQKQQLEATLQREAERARAVEELGRELEQTLEQLEENGLSSEELLEKLAEMRELMAEVLSPELREALQELQQAMDSQDPGELAEALRQFNQDQEAFQQRLERTIAMLERVRTEQRLEAAVKQAAELAKRQGQINEELDADGDLERLAEQEGSLERDTQRLAQDLSELSRAMESYSPETARQLAATAEHMAQQDFSGRMRQMMGHMEASALTQARRQGQGLEQDLGELAAGMQQLQQDFVADQKQLLADEMRRAMRGLLGLSARQEQLRDTVSALTPKAAADLAQEQFALMQGVEQVATQIGVIGERTLALEHPLVVTMGYALRHMREAAVRLGQRDVGRASSPQQAGMGYLNESVLLLRQSLDNLAQSRMPSSFGEAMQKMLGLSQQQAQLNQATQQALAEAQLAGRSGQSMQALAARLAAEQRRIHQALEKLRREIRGHRGAEQRLEAIEQEMKSVLGDLDRRQLSQNTLRQQQRILQRMLDASRSIHSRGQDEHRRRSSTGEDQEYAGPAWLPKDLGQSPDALRDAMRRALEAPYPAEYRPIIQRYYEQLYRDAQGWSEADSE
jgi:uncharacterized protein DUF4175